jgi:hypothetical protein
MASAVLSLVSGVLRPRRVVSDPFADIDDVDRVPTDSQTAAELEALVEKTWTEVLAYHFANRLANTAKNYIPKQREWSVSLSSSSFPPSHALLLSLFLFFPPSYASLSCELE